MAWRWSDDGYSTDLLADGRVVLSIYESHGGGQTPNEEEGFLIQAAPDTYEALRNLLKIGKRDLSNPKYDGYFEAARRALASAEGRS